MKFFTFTSLNKDFLLYDFSSPEKLYDGRSVAVRRFDDKNYIKDEHFVNEVKNLGSLCSPKSCAAIWIHLLE